MIDTIQGGAPLKDGCVRKGKPLRADSDLPDEVRERLDALFSRDALQDALEGVDPDRITGPGGLITELAGRVIEARAGGRADRASRASAGRRARRGKRAQRVDAQDAANRSGAG